MRLLTNIKGKDKLLISKGVEGKETISGAYSEGKGYPKKSQDFLGTPVRNYLTSAKYISTIIAAMESRKIMK